MQGRLASCHLEHPRRAAPRHPLPLRPAGQPAPHVVRLRPAPHCRTPILAYSLRVQPDDALPQLAAGPVRQLPGAARLPQADDASSCVEVDLVAEMTVINPFDFFLEKDAENYPFAYAPACARDLDAVPARRRRRAPLRRVRRAARSRTRGSGRRIDRLPRRPEPARPAAAPLRHPHGAGRLHARRRRSSAATARAATSPGCWCRSLRHLGLAARFVSGYSIQLKRRREAARRARRASSATSPICTPGPRSILPGAGWVGLDATSGLLAGEGHIPLACTADPETAAPITGQLRAGRSRTRTTTSVEETFRVLDVRARAIHETPRVTLPYTEEQWSDDRRARARPSTRARRGRRAPDDGRRADLRRRSTTARRPSGTSTRSGPTKRRYADATCCGASTTRFAPDGLLHYGQGKWYPGEPLPRWALACYFRRDGVPIWHDADLFAEGASHGSTTADDARAVRRGPRRRGSASSRSCAHRRPTRTPGTTSGASAGCRSTSTRYESKLDDRTSARAWRASSSRGSASVVGYALPLRRAIGDAASARWQSGRWFLRPRAPVPAPGDSPMGYRLPLDSLPWAAPGDTDAAASSSIPFAPREPLPPRRASAAPARAVRPPRAGRLRSTPSPTPPKPFESTPGRRPHRPVRRAARRRAPRLPAAASRPSRTTSISSPPSRPPRRSSRKPRRASRATPAAAIRGSSSFQVTPDPGVIEVNIHPAAQLGRARREHRRSSTRRPATPASAPRSSCSTAATPAPAAATTSSSAAPTPADSPHPAPARPAAQPRRLLAQSSVAVVPVLGAVRRARPARRRASTRRATTASTSWRSPSARLAASHGGARRRGWSTASSATCSST